VAFRALSAMITAVLLRAETEAETAGLGRGSLRLQRAIAWTLQAGRSTVLALPRCVTSLPPTALCCCSRVSPASVRLASLHRAPCGLCRSRTQISSPHEEMD
jgi:hypothetical protein